MLGSHTSDAAMAGMEWALRRADGADERWDERKLAFHLYLSEAESFMMVDKTIAKLEDRIEQTS
jgi:hypothetical protein